MIYGCSDGGTNHPICIYYKVSWDFKDYVALSKPLPTCICNHSGDEPRLYSLVGWEANGMPVVSNVCWSNCNTNTRIKYWSTPIIWFHRPQKIVRGWVSTHFKLFTFWYIEQHILVVATLYLKIYLLYVSNIP